MAAAGGRHRLGLRLLVVGLGVAVGLTPLTGLGPAPVSASAAPLKRTWLALGDSYSSGEGQAATTRDRGPNDKECARAVGGLYPGDTNSAKAWPVVAFEQVVKEQDGFAPIDFVACTGAITDDWDEQLKEAREQSSHTSWDVVTMSFGGNNVEFGPIIKGCLDVNSVWGLFDRSPGCDIDADTLEDRVAGLAYPEKPAPASGDVTLAELYDRVAEHVRPGGTVVVAGYPHIVEEVERRELWRQTRTCDGIWGHDVKMLRQATNQLNDAIRREVTKAGERSEAAGVKFIFADLANDVYETESGRHSTCTTDPWINGLTTGLSDRDWRTERSFHPTVAGHLKSGEYVASLVLKRLDDGGVRQLNDHRNRLGWKVSTDGAGPLQLGMRGQAGESLGVAVRRRNKDCADVAYQDSGLLGGPEVGAGATPAVRTQWDGPSGVLSLIYITSSRFSTLSGLRVGDSAARVRSVLGSRVRPAKDRGDLSDVLLVRESKSDRYVEFLLYEGRVYAIAVGTGSPANSGIDYC